MVGKHDDRLRVWEFFKAEVDMRSAAAADSDKNESDSFSKPRIAKYKTGKTKKCSLCNR